MNTKIISGFPGVGKSVCTRNNPDYLDSDSSGYSWLRDRSGAIAKDANGKNIRHPEFPQNYIDHIKGQIGRAPVIFVSSHKEVRDALAANRIPFTLVYPDLDLKEEYLERFRSRGSPPAFLTLIENNWNNFLTELNACQGCDRVVLAKGQFLVDCLDDIQTVAVPSQRVNLGPSF